jgi:uncharacterized Zn-binding protein involved in type VI secretion
MPAAARVGDNTEHGSSLGPGPGSTNVRIGGMPAWRAWADVHACPLFDGPTKPHGSGMVAGGSGRVWINNCPAARMGDKIVEVGTVDGIASGCTRVMIGT